MANSLQAIGAGSAIAVTKSDTATYSESNGGPLDAVYVGGDGNLALLPVGSSSAVTFEGVAAGSIIPVRCSKVMSTNTTATALVGLRF